MKPIAPLQPQPLGQATASSPRPLPMQWPALCLHSPECHQQDAPVCHGILLEVWGCREGIMTEHSTGNKFHCGPGDPGLWKLPAFPMLRGFHWPSVSPGFSPSVLLSLSPVRPSPTPHPGHTRHFPPHWASTAGTSQGL